MNEFDWSRCYQILELDPRADGDGLRAAYRSQIRRWHPDRVDDRPETKRLADERAKAINNAYKRLMTYYRAHGHLPDVLNASQPTNPLADEPIHAASNQEAPSPPSFWTAEPPESPLHVPKTRRVSVSTMALVAVATAFAVYIARDNTLPSAPARSGPELIPGTVARNPLASAQDHIATPASLPTRLRPAFTVGSTVGEVYSAQGTPTRTDNSTWYYGMSRVHFANGRVTQWDETVENPLNTRLDTKPRAPSPNLIAIGASKNDVRAIQGDPVRETPSTWEYGVSRVYFKNDLVSGWEESPLYPLRLQH